MLVDDDFQNLIDNLVEYYKSLGDDLFEYNGRTLQDLILIRTAQVLAEKGNRKMEFYLNEIRKKVVDVYEDGFDKSAIISKLQEDGFDKIGLNICETLFNLHAKEIGTVLEGIEGKIKAMGFADKDPTSRAWFISTMIAIDPKFERFYNNSKGTRPVKI